MLCLKFLLIFLFSVVGAEIVADYPNIVKSLNGFSAILDFSKAKENVIQKPTNGVEIVKKVTKPRNDDGISEETHQLLLGIVQMLNTHYDTPNENENNANEDNEEQIEEIQQHIFYPPPQQNGFFYPGFMSNFQPPPPPPNFEIHSEQQKMPEQNDHGQETTQQGQPGNALEGFLMKELSKNPELIKNLFNFVANGQKLT